jgi:hypothetical protein
MFEHNEINDHGGEGVGHRQMTAEVWELSGSVKASLKSSAAAASTPEDVSRKPRNTAGIRPVLDERAAVSLDRVTRRRAV